MESNNIFIAEARISLKLNLVTFLDQKRSKNRLFVLMCRYVS